MDNGTEDNQLELQDLANKACFAPIQDGTRQKPLSNKVKYFTAAAIFYGNITFGLVFTTYGPALTSLQHKYETDDATISTVFTYMTFGSMMGGLSSGMVFNYVNRQLAVIIIATMKAIIMFTTPHCPTLTTFFISAGVLGFFCGSYNTAQFVWMVEMMQKDCPPFVQSQHFFFAVGTILASLIMAPFLETGQSELPEFSLELFYNTSLPVNETSSNVEVAVFKLVTPYTIIGILVSITAIVQLLLFIFMRYHPPPTEIITSEETERLKVNQNGNEDSEIKVGSWPLGRLYRVILCVAFSGALQGIEWGLFQFFPKFGQNSDLQLPESESAYVLSGMTTAHSLGRAISIFAVFKMPSKFLLWGNITMCVVANVILVTLANNSLNMLWTSSILFGLGLSSMYGSFTVYLERYLNFTNFVGSCMVVSGSVVGILNPLIVGSYIENNVIVLCYTTFCSIGTIILAVGLLNYLTHKDGKRY